MSQPTEPELTYRPVVLKANGGGYLSLEDALTRGWVGVKIVPCKHDDSHLAGWAVYEMDAEGQPSKALSVHKTAKLAEWAIDAKQIS